MSFDATLDAVYAAFIPAHGILTRQRFDAEVRDAGGHEWALAVQAYLERCGMVVRRVSTLHTRPADVFVIPWLAERNPERLVVARISPVVARQVAVRPGVDYPNNPHAEWSPTRDKLLLKLYGAGLTLRAIVTALGLRDATSHAVSGRLALLRQRGVKIAPRRPKVCRSDVVESAGEHNDT